MIRLVWRGFTAEFTFLFAMTVTFCLLTDETGLSTLALSACILHESGHLLAFALTGVKPRAIVFELCGIRLIPPERRPPFLKELLIQSGGILMNFILCALCLLIKDGQGGAAHFLLGCFSLLPLRTLDGGAIVRLLTDRFLPLRFSRFPDFLDTAVTVLLCLLCLTLLLTGKFPLTLTVFSGGLLGSLFGGAFTRLKRKRCKL